MNTVFFVNNCFIPVRSVGFAVVPVGAADAAVNISSAACIRHRMADGSAVFYDAATGAFAAWIYIRQMSWKYDISLKGKKCV